MKKILSKGQVVASEYEVRFFVDASDWSQKYRVKSRDGKTFLLKLQNSSKLSSDSFSGQNLLEVEILKLANNEGIAKYVDSGELVEGNQKYHFVVLDFISGESLLDKMKRESLFSPISAVQIVLNLLKTVRELHNNPRTIIHNNINLHSVMLDYSGGGEKPILTDFDFARYISSRNNSLNLRQLSPFYVAPELFNGICTPQSDIFSLGALLYHLITGTPPWYIELPKYQFADVDQLDAILASRARKLSFGVDDSSELIDDHLRATILAALAPDVDDRFQKAEEFIEALEKKKMLSPSEKTADTVPQRNMQKKGQGFAAIAGMKELKSILYDDVIRALNEKELYQRYGVTIPNGMLLYGPPGCGKTFISERFAEEVGFNFVKLNPSDIKSKWVNETEEKIGKIFKEAAANAPTIIFIDEIDAIVPTREGDLHHMSASAVNELLAQMSNCSEKGIFVIAASNRPEKIDPAVLRTGRVDRIVYLPPPDCEARAAMFELYLKDRPVDLSVNYQLLADKTEDYVASDIKYLVDEASRSALRLKERVTMEILEKVISEVNPSVSIDELERYKHLRAQFENRRKSKKGNNKSIGLV